MTVPWAALELVSEMAAVVPGLERDALDQLVLQVDAPLPVVRPDTPAMEELASLTRATLSPVLPKFSKLPVTAPHVSLPPPACAAGFRMSQSTT